MKDTATVGAVEIVSLMDVSEWRIPNFFPTADPDVWESCRALYPESLCDGRSICTTATAYLLRTPSLTVLVDTGLGHGPHKMMGGQMGRLLGELRAIGVEVGDVDVVVMTHLHFDHVGWNATVTDAGVEPTFPRARYLISRADWEYFATPMVYDASPFVWDTYRLFASGVIDLVSGEHVVSQEITLVPTPGHTPGHQAVFVNSQGEGAAIIGDMAHSPAQVQEVGWSPSIEHDPRQSEITRSRTFDRIERERLLLCAGHFPRPGFGHLVRMAGRRHFKAL